MHRCTAQLSRGQASNKETEEEEKDDDEDDNDNLAVPLEAQACLNAIEMFKWTLLFSESAATALYDDQAVQSLDTLCEIDDDMIK